MSEEMKPAEQPASQPAPAPAPQAQQSAPAPAAAIDNNKLMAAISYIGVLFLIPLLTEAKNDEFVKFHVRQGIALFLVWVVASFIVWIPFIGQMTCLALVVLSIFAAVKAYQGERWELPVVGQYAKQIKL
ncbi:MAG: hypothetical protein WCT10_04200 [Patescibacteria group bacterium]|jgi:uncharacterized membrane protein